MSKRLLRTSSNTRNLTVDKNGKFLVDVRKLNASLVKNLKEIPGSRYRPGKELLGLEPIWSTAKILNYLVDYKGLLPSNKAKVIMRTITHEQKSERRRIRAAEAKFKKNANTLPVPLKNPPMPFQVRCVGFGTTVTSAAFLNRPGTGKTFCGIATAGIRFLDGKIKRVLVVCPKSVMPIWPREFEKHADFGYSIIKIKKKWDTPEEQGLEVIVINYDKIKPRMKDILKWNPDMVILDESHRIGNPTSQRSKACHKLGDSVKYKLCLTGTPLGQTPLGIWSQYRFLNKDIFGITYKSFRERYAIMGGYMNKQIFDYKNLDELAEKMHSISFRITEDEVLQLPGQVTQIIYCEPDKITKELYKKMDKELGFTFNNQEVEVEQSVSRLIKLRQITSGAVKSSEGDKDLIHISDIKIKILKDILSDNPGKKVIFTSFKHEIRAIGALLEGLGINYLTLHGGTPDDEREVLEERFTQEKDLDILIIQITTGAEGQDFTAANISIFYSPVYSWIYTDQAKARIYRIGQMKKVRHIFIVMEGTIEEKIVNLLDTIGDMSTDLLENKRTYKLTRG